MSAAPQKAKPGAEKIAVVVSAVVPVNELVTRFEFQRQESCQIWLWRANHLNQFLAERD